MPNTTITLRQLATAAILDLHGDITAGSEQALMEAYAQATAAGARSILLNFGDLAYMNSGGIGLLVTLLIRANRARQRLLAYGLSDHYRQIFELTRLNDAIAIFETEAEALRPI
jgi:anti-sigma B factor antagonist